VGGKGPDKADWADTEEPMKQEEENGRERKLERVTRMKGRNRQDKKERATDNNVKESSGRNALIYSMGYLRTGCMEYCCTTVCVILPYVLVKAHAVCTLLEVRSTFYI
jgi:hypothetical protein